MATFLDVTLLENFRGVFTWLLVWIISFGVLEMTKPMGDDKEGLHALIAVALAFFVLFSAPARGLIEFAVPWLTVLGILAFFLIFAMLTFSDKEDVMGWLDGNLKGWVTTLAIVVLIFGLSGVLGGQDQQQQQAPAQQGNGTYDYDGSAVSGSGPGQAPQQAQQQGEGGFADTLVATFTHPKVLGALFLLLLANFAIANLAKQN